MFKKNRLVVIVCLSVFVLTIGFSSFGVKLDIDDVNAIVRAQVDVRINNLELEEITNSAVSNYENYGVDVLELGFSLPEPNSTITYKLNVINYGNVEMALTAIKGLPNNLEYFIYGYDMADKICIDNECVLGVEKEITITIKYIDGMFDPDNCDYSVILEFVFEQYIIEPPTIIGCGDTWVKTCLVSLKSAGIATDGIVKYEIYTTTGDDAPNNSTEVKSFTTDDSSNQVLYTSTASRKVYYRTVSKYGYKSDWSEWVYAKTDENLPSWSIQNISSQNVLTTDSVTFSLIGSDTEQVVSSSITASSLTFMADGVTFSPIVTNVEKMKDSNAEYKITIDKIPATGDLSMLVAASTLEDEAGNVSTNANLNLGVNVEKNDKIKILILSEVDGNGVNSTEESSVIYAYLNYYYSNVIFDIEKNDDEIINEEFDVVVYSKYAWSVTRDLTPLFEAGINIISDGNDTGSSFLPGAVDSTSCSVSGYATKLVDNTFTSFFPDSIDLYSDTAKCKIYDDSTISLFGDDNNDYMVYFEDDGTRWIHNDIINPNFTLLNKIYAVIFVQFAVGDL